MAGPIIQSVAGAVNNWAGNKGASNSRDMQLDAANRMILGQQDWMSQLKHMYNPYMQGGASAFQGLQNIASNPAYWSGYGGFGSTASQGVAPKNTQPVDPPNNIQKPDVWKWMWDGVPPKPTDGSQDMGQLQGMGGNPFSNNPVSNAMRQPLSQTQDSMPGNGANAFKSNLSRLPGTPTQGLGKSFGIPQSVSDQSRAPMSIMQDASSGIDNTPGGISKLPMDQFVGAPTGSPGGRQFGGPVSNTGGATPTQGIYGTQQATPWTNSDPYTPISTGTGDVTAPPGGGMKMPFEYPGTNKDPYMPMSTGTGEPFPNQPPWQNIPSDFATSAWSNFMPQVTSGGASVGPVTVDEAGLKFARQQAEDASRQRMAAMGLGNSGAAIKEAAALSANLGNQYYGDAFNRALQTAQLQNQGVQMGLQASGMNQQANLDARRLAMQDQVNRFNQGLGNQQMDLSNRQFGLAANQQNFMQGLQNRQFDWSQTTGNREYDMALRQQQIALQQYLANMAMQATNQYGQYGTGIMGGIGQTTLGMGNAQAAAEMAKWNNFIQGNTNAANAWSGMFGSKPMSYGSTPTNGGGGELFSGGYNSMFGDLAGGGGGGFGK